MRRGGRGYGGGGPHRPQMNIPRQLQPPQQPQRPQFNDGNSGHGGGGPLMTDHLQGLKDIDMELELLKRKREIIEQQQQILSNSYRQEMAVSYNQPRDSRSVDYTSMYDEPRAEYRGESRKRVHDVPVWDSAAPAPPKRFSGPSRGAKSFNSRFAPPTSSRGPASSSRFESRPEPRPEPRFSAPKPSYRRAAPPPRKPVKDFHPSKVAKASGPSQAQAPAPLARYAPAERRRLVGAAREHTVPASKQPDYWLLRADREPHAKLNGRLELALGSIMKEIRAANPQYDHLFISPMPTRTMKTVVRGRIRNVMIGKHVTTTDNIKASYYEAYPCRKHEYVVMQGLEAVKDKNPKLKLVDSDSAETFFKKNMHYLMNKKLDEMMITMQHVYGSGANYDPLTFKNPRDRMPKVCKATDTKQTEGAENTPNNPEGEDKTENGTQVQTENAEIQATDQTTESEPNQDTTESKIEENAPAIDDDVQIIDDTMEVVEIKDKEIIPEDEEDKNITLKFINDDMYKALDKLMTYKILNLLKLHVPDMVKILDLDKYYRKCKHDIFEKTKEKLLNKPGEEEGEKASNQQSSAARSAQLKKTPDKRGPAQFYVKILGKPYLPKRKAMETFFKDFQPRTIKKHKTVHNLLFVGFTDKESYDKILAADGQTIGRFTLDIKVSERNSKPNVSQDSIVTVDGDADKANESTEIGSDLDNQISDLLSSIRQSEFEATDGDAEVAEPTEAKHNENGDAQTKAADEVIDIDAENTEVKQTEDDVIQFDDVPQNDNVPETQETTGAVAESNEQNEANTENAEEKHEKETIPENGDANKAEEKVEKINDEAKDKVTELKTAVKEVPKTPTRASARIATPSGIKTRRMSRLAE